eukprot:TRINITY_DN135_c0_g1_i1.p1 TRINITY_DN135_c0_g1~~TRINITY_DN135_c0_g1_i1.p1  ORF type:complete len:206 (-),score=32.26 TRINITY_DN135_c0_g1_i1:32-649(-)
MGKLTLVATLLIIFVITINTQPNPPSIPNQWLSLNVEGYVAGIPDLSGFCAVDWPNFKAMRLRGNSTGPVNINYDAYWNCDISRQKSTFVQKICFNGQHCQCSVSNDECKFNPLEVPPGSQFEGYSEIKGHNCSTWSFQQGRNNLFYGVSVNDNNLRKLVWSIGQFNQGYTFTNVTVGTPNPSFFSPPNCEDAIIKHINLDNLKN